MQRLDIGESRLRSLCRRKVAVTRSNSNTDSFAVAHGERVFEPYPKLANDIGMLELLRVLLLRKVLILKPTPIIADTP